MNVTEGTWHCVEQYCGPMDGASPSTSLCSWWYDGALVYSYTANAWGNGATQWSSIQLGDIAVGTGSFFAPHTMYLDQVTIANNYILPYDVTGPSAPPAVRDGTTGVDISTTDSTTQLSANWDASTDNESSISGYQYAIGTTAGATDTVGWTTLGNVLAVTKTGLTLVNGQTYFFSVKAVNGVGVTGSAANSDGQTVSAPSVDTTPPSPPPSVRDGTGADISTTSSLVQLSANWDASTDNESGISGYKYAIGTSAGGTDITVGPCWAT